MKRNFLSCVLFVVLLAAPAAFAAPAIGTDRLVNATGEAQESWDVLDPPTLEVVVDNDPVCVWVDWSQDNVDTTRSDVTPASVRIYLTLSETDGKWRARLPVNHAGLARYSIFAEDANGEISPPGIPGSYNNTENTNAVRALANQRFPNMMKWGSSTGNLDTDWYGQGVTHEVSERPQMVTLRGTTTEATPTPTGTTAGGFVRTRAVLSDGVGSVWFKAKMAETNVTDGTLVLEKITYTLNDMGRPVYSYEELATISVPPATENYEWYQFHLIVQDSPESDPDKGYFRIRNKTLANSDSDRAKKAIDLCDIILTPPIPDVKIYKDEADYSPGYPSILDPIEFHISVSNLYASAPASNFTPRLVWRQKSGIDWDDWTPTPMTNLLGRTETGDGTYACVLTDADITDGAFEYYYEVGFTGYTPTFPYLVNPGHPKYNNIANDRFRWNESPYLVHTNEIALLTMDLDGKLNEGRSPACYPDFATKYREDDVKNGPFWIYSTNFCLVAGSLAEASGTGWGYTHKFDLRYLNLGWPDATCYRTVYDANSSDTSIQEDVIEIPAMYEYLKFLAPDGIRRFRSRYNGVAAVTRDLTPTNARPEFLDFSYPMQHVGDYVWQAILPMSGAIDHYFSVTGAMEYVEAESRYEAGPFEWLQLDQKETDINPPMSGDMTGRSHLRPFQAEPTDVVSTVFFTTNYTLYAEVPTDGLYVGLVTNELEEGAAHTAKVANVVYWFRRLEVKFDRATDSYLTNSFAVYDNYHVITNELSEGAGTGPEFTKASLDEFNSIIHDVDNGGGSAFYVTNDYQRVVESLTERKITKKMTGQITRTVYEPTDEDLAAEGEAEWEVYHPGEGPFPGWSALRTRVQIDYSGFLMFRFCTTNGAWQIRRAAWQDFNTWQADNTKYSRSFGIYDMKTFESDLAGRDLTTFDGNLDFSTLDEGFVAETEGWSEASTNLYWNGFAGSGMRLVKERAPAKKGSTSRNTAVWLNTHPTRQGPGHLETTLAQGGQGGRGTLTMRVRSASDDDRNITWKAADEMTDYKVVARIEKPETATVSDGEHSLSLIGYYEDPFNYWEARIIQKTFLTGDTKRPERAWFEVHIYKWTEGVREEVFGTVSHKNMWGENNYTANDTTRARFPGWKNAAANGGPSQYWDNPAQDGTFLRANKDTGGWTFVFELTTEGGAAKPVLYAYYTGDLMGDKRRAADNQRYFKYDASAAGNRTGGSTKGRPGYNMRDCGLKVAPYAMTVSEWDARIGTANLFKNSTAAELKDICQKAGATYWDFSEKASYDRDQRINVWDIETDSTVSESVPVRLTRPAPVVWYAVRVYREQAEETTDFMAPIGKYVNNKYVQWDSSWDAYHGNKRKDRPQFVQSYAWQPVEIPMSLWDETFINIQALPDVETSYAAQQRKDPRSHGVLAVDDLACDDWRGVTVYDADYSDTAAPERNQTDSFVATYSVIAQDPRDRFGRVYELNRSRANPRKTQGIDTPLLIRGVGDVMFSYRVEDDPDKGHPVDIAVQVVNETGTRSSDLFATNLPVGAAGTLYVPCLSNITGRLRIVARTPDTADEGELGTIYVDNIRATDYPVTGDTSWEVYNALVSSFPDRRNVKFDGTSEAAAAYRSAVLNDDVQRDTLQGHEFSEHVPFVQTPAIETGVGEVSFWYRAAPDNGDPPSKPATITLMVADTSKRPDGEWRPLVPDDLSWDKENYSTNYLDPSWQEQAAQLATLSNVTNKRWTYFNVEFYKKDYRVLRIVSGDEHTTTDDLPKPNRVMLDNVLITEPVRASIDVGSIEFLPSIPLSTMPTGAKVTLVNPRMGPANIAVELDWYASAPDAELEPFPIRTMTIDSYEKAIPMYTNIVIEGESIRVSWTRYQTIATTNWPVEVTRLPAAMKNDATRKWGYEEWKNEPALPRMRGTIGFTNAPNSAYTFYSTNTIPTDTFVPDTMFQYCVRVKYTGKFAEDVLSETQGKVRNGFWFDNPSYYEPIDLNVAFDSKEQPVAHAFVFSCTTNVVFFNEFRPWLGVNNHQDIQFVELLGPAGAKIGGWSIEHFGPRNGVLPANYVFYTNILAKGAAFSPVNNASPDIDPPKGWGTYILGCSGIEEADEPLFPPEVEDSWDTVDMRAHPFLNIPGAMRLRRSMGAYVDKIVWGPHSDITDVEKLLGFTWASTMGYDQAFNTESYVRYVFNREGDVNSMVWRTTGSSTIGGYNYGQETILPWLDGTEEEKKLPPQLETVFTGYSFTTNKEGVVSIDLQFRVRTLDNIALEKDSGYVWDVEASGNLVGWMSLGERGQVEFLQDSITADAEGHWSDDFSVRVPATENVRFFRIRGTTDPQ